jgi:hypothetical protein
VIKTAKKILFVYLVKHSHILVGRRRLPVVGSERANPHIRPVLCLGIKKQDTRRCAAASKKRLGTVRFFDPIHFLLDMRPALAATFQPILVGALACNVAEVRLRVPQPAAGNLSSAHFMAMGSTLVVVDELANEPTECKGAMRNSCDHWIHSITLGGRERGVWKSAKCVREPDNEFEHVGPMALRPNTYGSIVATISKNKASGHLQVRSDYSLDGELVARSALRGFCLTDVGTHALAFCPQGVQFFMSGDPRVRCSPIARISHGLETRYISATDYNEPFVLEAPAGLLFGECMRKVVEFYKSERAESPATDLGSFPARRCQYLSNNQRRLFLIYGPEPGTPSLEWSCMLFVFCVVKSKGAIISSHLIDNAHFGDSAGRIFSEDGDGNVCIATADKALFWVRKSHLLLTVSYPPLPLSKSYLPVLLDSGDVLIVAQAADCDAGRDLVCRLISSTPADTDAFPGCPAASVTQYGPPPATSGRFPPTIRSFVMLALLMMIFALIVARFISTYKQHPTLTIHRVNTHRPHPI